MIMKALFAIMFAAVAASEIHADSVVSNAAACTANTANGAIAAATTTFLLIFMACIIPHVNDFL